MNSACVPIHVLIQSVAADISEAPALGSRDRLQGSPGPGGYPHPDLRRRALARLTADTGAAAEPPADLRRVGDDPRPARFGVAGQPVGVLAGGSLGRRAPGPCRLGGNLLRRGAHQPGDLTVARGIDLGAGHPGQPLSQRRPGLAGPAACPGHGRYLLALTGRSGMAQNTTRSPASPGRPASPGIRPAVSAPMMNRPSPVPITHTALAAAGRIASSLTPWRRADRAIFTPVMYHNTWPRRSREPAGASPRPAGQHRGIHLTPPHAPGTRPVAIWPHLAPRNRHTVSARRAHPPFGAAAAAAGGRPDRGAAVDVLRGMADGRMLA